MRKLVLGLSLAQVLPEKINIIVPPNSFEFIDMNRTVCYRLNVLIFSGLTEYLDEPLPNVQVGGTGFLKVL